MEQNKEEFGLRVVDVIEGSFSNNEHVLIDVDEGTIAIHGVISSKKYRIKDNLEKIELISEIPRKKGYDYITAKLYLTDKNQFSADMERELYNRIVGIIH